MSLPGLKSPRWLQSTEADADRRRRGERRRSLQSFDDGLVGLDADLDFGPRGLVGRSRQVSLGLLQVGFGRLQRK